MYKKILVPLDGSKRAEKILPHVMELAENFEAQVILLGVLEPDPMVVPTEPFHAPFDRSLHDRRLVETETYLNTQRTKFYQRELPTSVRVIDGPVVETIIAIAAQEDVDLIAMASHGRTGLPRMIYGSVADGVLHRTNRPLLLIRSLD